MVLLLSVGTILYLGYKSTQPSEVIVEKVPTAAEPVRDYVARCVQETARDALRVLGEQGGYTDLSGNGFSFNPANPTEGTAVDFTSTVPYWFFMASRNDCIGTCYFRDLNLQLHKSENSPSIEEELEKYLKDNFETCIAGFDGLEAYQIINLSEPTFTATVNEEDVTFVVNYPLDVDVSGTMTRISEFRYAAPLNLKKMFEKAVEIKNAMKDYCFLENFALFKVSEFSRVDASRLPPISDVKFKNSGVYWLSFNVQNQLQNILEMYTPFLQMVGSNNYREIPVGTEVPNRALIQRSYNNMILPLDASGYSVYFNYFSDWPIYFKTNHGALIKPSSTMYVPLINLGVQRYETDYSFSFPVVVQMQDPVAFNKQGYNFNFALEANVRNTHCLESDYTPLVSNAVSGTSLMCEPDQKNSGNVSITVKNQNGERVPNVVVSFVSGEKCIIGETNASGMISDKLPVGIGALELEHPDYLGYKYPFTTEVDNPKKAAITIYKKNTKSAIVMKKNIQKASGWKLNDVPVPLSVNEQAVVILERVSDDGMEDYFTAFIYNGNDTGKQTIDLPPGKYKVTINLVDYQALNIPPSVRKAGSWPNKKKFTVPAVDMDMWQSGGLTFDENTGYWDVKPGNLLAANEIRFYAVALQRSDMQVVEDVEQMGNVDAYSVSYKTQLTPELIIR
jgi:hypothetical protein